MLVYALTLGLTILLLVIGVWSGTIPDPDQGLTGVPHPVVYLLALPALLTIFAFGKPDLKELGRELKLALIPQDVYGSGEAPKDYLLYTPQGGKALLDKQGAEPGPVAKDWAVGYIKKALRRK